MNQLMLKNKNDIIIKDENNFLDDGKQNIYTKFKPVNHLHKHVYRKLTIYMLTENLLCIILFSKKLRRHIQIFITSKQDTFLT